MGNSCCCLNRSSSTIWAASDDWALDREDSGLPGPYAAKKPVAVDKQNLLRLQNKAITSSSSRNTSNKEVKIAISEKQLQELLGRRDVHNVPLNQVLSRMINDRDHYEIHYQPSWRPALQTIPELN